MKSQYEKLKAKGFDMSWYERGKRALNAAIALEDEECWKGSIYLMKADGTLWTLSVTVRHAPGDKGKSLVTYSAEPHKQVRSTGKELPSDMYVCMHTKKGYNDLHAAMRHEECESITGGQQAAKEVM